MKIHCWDRTVSGIPDTVICRNLKNEFLFSLTTKDNENPALEPNTRMSVPSSSRYVSLAQFQVMKSIFIL